MTTQSVAATPIPDELPDVRRIDAADLDRALAQG